MLENRSVPPDTILPHVEYQDLAAAVAWLTKTFAFIEHYRYGDPISGAQLHIGNAWIMVNQADPGTIIAALRNSAMARKASPCSSTMSMLTSTTRKPPAPKSWKTSRLRSHNSPKSHLI